MKWLIRFLLGICFLNIIFIALIVSTSPYFAGGGSVAYTRIDSDYNPHILLIDVRSGLSLELTPPEFEGRAPTWTPDGTRITFSTVRNRDERHVLEVTLSTFQIRNLTEIWGYESVPIYSPIDSRIAFPAQPNTATMPLFVVDEMNPDAEPETLIESIRRSVAWSPDGQFLAYIAIPEQTENELSAGNAAVQTPNLFTLNLATGEIINWSANLPNVTYPVWSPDSTRIAITTTIAAAGNLQIINIETGEVTPILSASAGVQNPVWSPDGKQIAFTARENGDFEIFVMDMATGEVRNVSHSPSFDISPTWSADGNRIAYVSYRNGQNEIYVVHLATQRTYRLTYTPDDEGEVTWQPHHQ